MEDIKFIRKVEELTCSMSVDELKFLIDRAERELKFAEAEEEYLGVHN